MVDCDDIADDTVEHVTQVSLSRAAVCYDHVFLRFTDLLCCSSRLAGGKGAQLAQLYQLQCKQFIVPKGSDGRLLANNCFS